MASPLSRVRAEPRRGAMVAIGLIVAMAIAGRAQQMPPSPDAGALRAAVERGLRSAPLGFEALQAPSQAGVRVLDVQVEQVGPATRITIDLSQKTLTYDPTGDVDAVVGRAIASTAPLLSRAGDVDFRFLVEGLPLDAFLSRPAPSQPARVLADPGAHRVVISAGHGWYWNPWTSDWRLQRPRLWGIVEDLVNWDIAHYVAAQLDASVFQAQLVRHPTRDELPGVSGWPAWQEAALYFMKAAAVPPAVWDIGVDDYARDINTRPLYANWLDAVAVISIHNNGGEGTGTETWFDATNGHGASSQRLAEVVNRRVVAAIRREYNPNWVDRGLRSCNGCKGENRLAARPAIILEIAFMDTRTPDNEALQDERFKQIVARAIRDALHEWSGIAAPGRAGTD